MSSVFSTIFFEFLNTRMVDIVFCVEEFLEANNMTGLRDRWSLRP